MFLLLMLVAAVFCAPVRGADMADGCREAGTIVSTLTDATGDKLAALEDTVLHLCPDGAPGHLVKGMRHEQKGETELAIAEYRRALAANYPLTEKNGSLGLLLLYTQTRDDAARVKKFVPDNYRRQGDDHLLAREYDKAIVAYQAELKEHPGRTDALEKLGDAQMAAGQDEQAIATYRRLIAVNGTNSVYRYTLGVLYERQGMLDEAVDQYRQAVRQNPKNGDARRHLADIYTLRGNFPQAIREYREMLTEFGDNPLLHFKLARTYERSKKHNDAITEYLAAINLAPDNIEAHRELAALYRKRGRGAEAVSQYRAVLLLNRDDVSARNALISLFVKLKNYDELYLLLQEGVELFPDDPNSHFRLGLMYDFRREYGASEAEYRKTLALKSDHAKALKGLGKVYFKTGRLAEARECLEAAKKADPNLFEASELLNDLMKVERAAERRSNTHASGNRKKTRHVSAKKGKTSSRAAAKKAAHKKKRTSTKKKGRHAPESKSKKGRSASK